MLSVLAASVLGSKSDHSPLEGVTFLEGVVTNQSKTQLKSLQLEPLSLPAEGEMAKPERVQIRQRPESTPYNLRHNATRNMQCNIFCCHF